MGKRKHGVQNNAKTTAKLPGGITGKGFQPGASGNPGGRPKTRPISAALDRIGTSELPERQRKRLALPKGSTWFDGVAIAMLYEAANGNPAAAKEVRESIEGKAPQRVELSPVTIDFDSKGNAREALRLKLLPELETRGPIQ